MDVTRTNVITFWIWTMVRQTVRQNMCSLITKQLTTLKEFFTAKNIFFSFSFHQFFYFFRRLLAVPHSNLLILTGGRPGLFLWVSSDLGNSWETKNIAALHNQLVQPTAKVSNVTQLQYVKEVVNVKNYTNHRANPPATSSYFGSTFNLDGDLVLSYDRLSDGWHGAHPNGAYGSFDAMFTMIVSFGGEN